MASTHVKCPAILNIFTKKSYHSTSILRSVYKKRRRRWRKRENSIHQRPWNEQDIVLLPDSWREKHRSHAGLMHKVSIVCPTRLTFEAGKLPDASLRWWIWNSVSHQRNQFQFAHIDSRLKLVNFVRNERWFPEDGVIVSTWVNQYQSSRALWECKIP